jgi:multidrug efflux pump subunit AcrA (membrane-fusion protein)
MAGARPGQIAVAVAQLSQAQAALTTAQRAVSDTLTLIDSPQDIDLQIAVLRAQIESAREQQAQAVALKDAVEVAKETVDEVYARFDGGGWYRFEVAEGNVADLIKDELLDELSDQLPDDLGDNLPSTGDHTIEYGEYELHLDNGNYQLYAWKNLVFPMEATLLPNQWWQAWVGVNAAAARTEGLEAQLNQLYAQRANPQTMQAQLDEMRAFEAQLAAGVMMAEAQLDALQAGLIPEEITAIEAKVGQAYAGLEALMAQRDMLALTTPISGTVVDTLVYEGEVAAQGATLISVADLADLTLTVYVPGTRLGEVWLDQMANVHVDSFPGRTFQGYVSHISDSAEFTPRNVATVEERQNLVFAVDIRISNEGGDLKPGMPADVVFTADTRMLSRGEG